MIFPTSKIISIAAFTILVTSYNALAGSRGNLNWFIDHIHDKCSFLPLELVFNYLQCQNFKFQQHKDTVNFLNNNIYFCLPFFG